MRIYEIIDEERGLSVGTLLYYAKSHVWIIELQEWLDEWSAPLLLTSYVKKKIFTIPEEVSLLWVQERIIPPGRQNIQDILACHGLKEYDEMQFLELSEGRCSQDALYIKRIDDLPEYVSRRMEKNLADCILCGDFSLLCCFKDGSIRKVKLASLDGAEGVEKILNNPGLFLSGKPSSGGYSAEFDRAVYIPASLLYSSGTEIPLQYDDLLAFLQHNVLDTADASGMLGCTRQNLAYLVKQGKLKPVRENVKGNLFLKCAVEQLNW